MAKLPGFEMHDGWLGLRKVISGGQTGGDQGGLIAAWRSGLETGGTSPAGHYTETGCNPLLECFGLVPKGDYRSRTIENIKDSDVTIIFTVDVHKYSRGCVLTRGQCNERGKPVLDVDLTSTISLLATPGDAGATGLQATIAPITAFIREHRPTVLNVAGNREKHKNMLVTHATDTILYGVFEQLRKAGELALHS